MMKIQQSVLPSVFLGANYSQQYLSDNFKYGDGRRWSPFSYVTLNIHIPVSAHFKNAAITTGYRQRISQQGLLLEQKKADINFEVAQARTSLANAVLNMQSTRNSYELSKTIFHNQQQQYAWVHLITVHCWTLKKAWVQRSKIILRVPMN